MLSFICSGCGGFGHTPEESLDSGTTLTCDGCGAKTIVELHSPAGYKKRHEIEAQLSEATRIVDHWTDDGAVEALAKLWKVLTEKRIDIAQELCRKCGLPAPAHRLTDGCPIP